MTTEQGLLFALLGALLVLSAVFSSAETALFSLSQAERERAGGLVDRLLKRPQSLLITVLLANLLVNLLFFSFAARLYSEGPLPSWLAGLVTLTCILIVGEVLPKSIALRGGVRVARLGAIPLAALVPVFDPARRALGALLELAYRALGDAAREEAAITPGLLARVLEHSADQGELRSTEAEFLSGVIELGDVRVREIMKPRVDAIFLDRTASDPREVIERARLARETWLTVVEGDPDHVVGRVRLRRLLAEPDRPIDEFLVPVRFVPEVASALSVLQEFREAGDAAAVVVDEWGGTAGLVRLEDIFEEIVGDLPTEDEKQEQLVQDLGGGRFRVAGGLPIRDWNELFGFRVVRSEFETLAGFVTALLGRIPRPSDRVRAGALAFRVAETRGRRVVWVDVELAATESSP